MKKRSKALMAVMSVLVLVGGLRLALPWILEYYIDNKLANLASYSGSVEDIDVALWRGAYQIQDLVIRKRQAKELEPFFTSDTVDLSVEWDSLVNGRLVAELVFWQPELNMVEAMEEERSQTGEEVDWRRQFEAFFPFRFNAINVRNGRLRFRTPGIEAENAMVVSQINAEVENLTNVVEANDEAFARFSANGQVFKAPLELGGKVNPTAQTPTFDLNFTLNSVQLTALNPWLREYLNADAQSGTFELYTELAAADGRFEGYAKPFMENVELFDLDENFTSVLQGAWEAALDFAAGIFESDPEEDVASRVPISGTIDNPEAGVWSAMINVLRHAVTGTFTRSLENSVSLENGAVRNEAEENGQN